MNRFRLEERKNNISSVIKLSISRITFYLYENQNTKLNISKGVQQGTLSRRTHFNLFIEEEETIATWKDLKDHAPYRPTNQLYHNFRISLD